MTVRFIAEIGSNHNKDIVRTLKLIQKAKKIGCWAVKFQLFKAEKLYALSFKSHIAKMKKWELPIHFLDHIKYECENLDLKFICTPFDLEAVKVLKPYVDYFKIGSYENQWPELIYTVAKTKRPWMISGGLLEEHQWHNLYHYIANCGQDEPAVLFHCCSNYPAKPKNCNLNTIKRQKRGLISIKTGWSDHTVEPGVIYKAISNGAEYIEFHFDLEDGLGFESSIGHCWQPHQMREVIHNVRIGELAEIQTDTNEQEASKWRTDPSDGLRPLKEFREELLNGS